MYPIDTEIIYILQLQFVLVSLKDNDTCIDMGNLSNAIGESYTRASNHYRTSVGRTYL